MKTEIKNAPKFAQLFSDTLSDHNKTQRQIAEECGISPSVINRLCKSGTGSENHIVIVLQKFDLKRRRIIEILTDRRAELSEEPARSIWKNFRYAFVNEDEYLREICPFPLERAYGCTQFGIHILDVVNLAKDCGISQISDTSDINVTKMMKFISEFEEQFGSDARKAVLSTECKSYPPVLLLDFKNQRDASDYIDLINCKGSLLFGLPHLLIGNYIFGENGEITKHRNAGGIEFLYSLEGEFELTCDNTTFSAILEPGQTIFLLDARKSHRIKLVNNKSGRLLMIRYHPNKRNVEPGRKKTRKNKIHQNSRKDQP